MCNRWTLPPLNIFGISRFIYSQQWPIAAFSFNFTTVDYATTLAARNRFNTFNYIRRFDKHLDEVYKRIT